MSNLRSLTRSAHPTQGRLNIHNPMYEYDVQLPTDEEDLTSLPKMKRDQIDLIRWLGKKIWSIDLVNLVVFGESL